MAEHFDTPPVLSGEEQAQLQQMYGYLYRLSEKLNHAMNNITADQFADGTRETLTTATAEASSATEKEINTVKSLIIKTASVIRNEMDVISTQLKGSYEALSDDLGHYRMETDNKIEANSTGISQVITTTQTLEAQGADFASYRTQSENYIFAGILGYKDDMTPITGIAIGEGVTTYDQDGNRVLDNDKKVATFTAEKLSFYLNGAEVAYFSNNSMYISSAEIIGSLKMGRYAWRIQADGSMGLTVEV